MRTRFTILLFLLLAGSCLPSRLHLADITIPTNPSQPWAYTDLRALAPAGDQAPSHDLIAAYTRTAGPDLQVRLDLLDLDYQPDGDLYLALDTRPGGTARLPIQTEASLDWDLLLVMPASGRAYALTPNPDPRNRTASTPNPEIPAGFTRSAKIIPRLSRIPWQDYLVVSINAASLPEARYGFRLQAFITPAQGTVPADSLGPVRSDNLPPPRAPLILAFWNTFPAYTPAQALRRWDGAHTGPLGERHGLRLLLRAARRTRQPVVLLDLKTPASLSALDYLGHLPEIQELVAQGLIILPDALPGSPTLAPSPAALPDWALSRLLADERAVAEKFGLGASPILYSPSLSLLQAGPSARQSGLTEPVFLQSYPIIFTPLQDTRPVEWKSRTLIPLPVTAAVDQATPEGISIPVRRILLENALGASRAEPAPLLLGGDLANSTWGDPASSEASLGWIARHPWIQPVSGPDLQTNLALQPVGSVTPERFSAQGSQLSSFGLPETQTHLSQTTSTLADPLVWEPVALYSAQGQPSLLFGLIAPLFERVLDSPLYNPGLSQAAWQAYLSQFAPLPPEPDNLADLRSASGLPVGALFEAIHWASEPAPHADCHSDPDLDGTANCILATERFFSIYDAYGGRLLLLVEHTPGGVHQYIAPSTQFIAGLGEPSSWDLSAGPQADPAGLHGAFSEVGMNTEIYIPYLESERLSFTSLDGRVSKTFQFTASGLSVTYQTSQPVTIQLPVAIDPWERFSSQWGTRYQEISSPAGWAWELTGGPSLEVQTSARLEAFPFTASRPNLQRTEDPNLAYPRGHYLPFPLALVEIKGEGDFSINLVVDSGS